MLRYRKPLRLKEYDYSNPGGYFVTICTQNRECLFGDVKDEKMILNEAGRIIEKWWAKIPDKFPNYYLDLMTVMPNHFHGILTVGADPCVRPGADTRVGPYTVALPQVMQWFKTMTTNNYMQHVKNGILKPFPTRLWQRNYHEHVIRNETTLNAIREYVLNNPLKWHLDRNNPNNLR